MADFDLEGLLAPLSEESPCGDNLEYDPVFMELEQIAKGEEERQSGSEIIPAKEPDWKGMRHACADLLARTRDLRVAAYFARAEAALDGIEGLARGTALLRGYVERYWDAVHPRLEDDEDPIRINALAPLGAPEGLLGTLRRTVLVGARNVGNFTFRDLDVAEQRAPAPAEGTPATLELLSGALGEAGPDYAPHRVALLTTVLEDLAAIIAAFRATPTGAGPDFESLEHVLRRGLAFLQCGIDDGASAGDDAGADADADAGEGDVPAQGGARGKSGAGELRNRDDAKRLLEQVCVFLERTEPSNPAPILIRRAQKLLDLSFLDIIQNLAPEALGEVQKLAGPAE